MPSSTASRWRRRSRRSWPSWASSSARSPRRCSEHPELVRKYLGSVVPYNDNFFAALNSAVFSDGSFCYIPKGVRCPMELSTYFRINAPGHRPVRADADRRRGRARTSATSKAARRRCATRTSCTPRSSSWSRVGERLADQVLDGAELVPRRQGGPRRHLQLRDQARRVPRRGLEDLVDAGGDRLGDHLEVPERASCRATTRSASSTRWR